MTTWTNVIHQVYPVRPSGLPMLFSLLFLITRRQNKKLYNIISDHVWPKPCLISRLSVSGSTTSIYVPAEIGSISLHCSALCRTKKPCCHHLPNKLPPCLELFFSRLHVKWSRKKTTPQPAAPGRPMTDGSQVCFYKNLWVWGVWKPCQWKVV